MKHSELTTQILKSNRISTEREKEFFKELRLTLRLDYDIPATEVRKMNDNKVIEEWYRIHSLPENAVYGA